MKAVLISIRPHWCELIASGKKTIEVRRTRPKIDTPFKCYIYQTMTGYVSKSKENDILVPTTYGKVIGEFVCDNIFCWVKIGYMNSGVKPAYHFGANIAMTCLTYDELEKYAKCRPVFGWHISDLVIYDNPKKLQELYGYCGMFPQCGLCGDHCPVRCRPPQSWSYLGIERSMKNDRSL